MKITLEIMNRLRSAGFCHFDRVTPAYRNQRLSEGSVVFDNLFPRKWIFYEYPIVLDMANFAPTEFDEWIYTPHHAYSPRDVRVHFIDFAKRHYGRKGFYFDSSIDYASYICWKTPLGTFTWKIDNIGPLDKTTTIYIQV